MEINTLSAEDRVVEDWDFNFRDGTSLSLTVDYIYGDTYKFMFDKNLAEFSLKAKPSLVDPDEYMDEEEHYIVLSNTNCIRKRTRLLEEPSMEEKEEWQRVFRELTDPHTPKH